MNAMTRIFAYLEIQVSRLLGLTTPGTRKSDLPVFETPKKHNNVVAQFPAPGVEVSVL